MNNTFHADNYYIINPYFTEDPAYYYISLKVITLINIFVSGIVLYCMIFKSPKILSKTFIGLLSYHVVLGILLLIHLSFLATPIFYLPYIAVKCVGIYSTLGVPTAVQAGILATLVLDMTCTIVPLFYYRMDALLPPSHILNSKCLRYLIYFLFYGLFHTLPLPLFYLLVAYSNQHDLKQRLLQSVGIFYEDFMSDRVAVTHLDSSNPFSYSIPFGLVPVICVFDIVTVVTSSYNILKLTSNVGIIGSVKYKTQQRQLFYSLLVVTTVFLPVIGCFIPINTYLLYTNSLRVDIVNILIIFCAVAIPFAFFLYGFTYKPYRQFLMAPFVLAVLTALLTGIALYTVLFKSPKILSKTFIALTIYHIIIGLLLLIHMSTLSTLFMYLPYIALKCVGVYSDLGIPTAVQIGILVTLIFDMASAAVPLFYYRMDVLLPHGHVLNSKCLRYFIYTCVYGLFNIIPVPLFCLIVAYDSQYEMKRRIFQSMGVFYEDFMSDWIIIMEMNGSNPFFNFLSYGLVPYMCVFNVSIAVTSSYVILKLTSNVGIIGSAKYKAQQRQLFFSLATMTIVVLPVVGCLFPIAVYLIFSNSYRADIVNTLIVTCFSSIPIGFLLYGISYRPYRQFVLSLFFKRPAPLSPFVVARPTKPTM